MSQTLTVENCSACGQSHTVPVFYYSDKAILPSFEGQSPVGHFQCPELDVLVYVVAHPEARDADPSD